MKTKLITYSIIALLMVIGASFVFLFESQQRIQVAAVMSTSTVTDQIASTSAENIKNNGIDVDKLESLGFGYYRDSNRVYTKFSEDGPINILENADPATFAVDQILNKVWDKNYSYKNGVIQGILPSSEYFTSKKISLANVPQIPNPKTFTDKNLGFTFKYPSNQIYGFEKNDYCSIILPQKIANFLDHDVNTNMLACFITPEDLESSPSPISFNVTKMKDYLGFDPESDSYWWYDDLNDTWKYLNGDKIYNWTPDSYSGTNLKAYRYITGTKSYQNDYRGSSQVMIIDSKHQNIIQFMAGTDSNGDSSVMNYILSTFQFTD